MTKGCAAKRFYHDVACTYQGDECLTWPFSTDKGYGQMTVARKNIAVHRAVCEVFNGPPPTQKHEAAHSCNNGHLGCCAGKHLRWATSLENNQDKIKNGTTRRGSKHHNAKLTEGQVREMLSLKGLISAKEMMKKFSISSAQMYRILSGERWGWLQDNVKQNQAA